MLTIDRIDNWKYSYGGTPEEIAYIEKCLTVKNPNAFFISKQTGYDIDSDVKLYSGIDKTFGHGLIDFFLDRMEEFERKGVEAPPFKIIDFDYKDVEIKCHDFLRYYQSNAVNAIFKYKFGTIKVPTRGGKTIIAAEFIRQLLIRNGTTRIVFFVDSIDLFDQTVKELKKFLNCSVGEIKAGKMDLSHNITVAMVQTAAKILATSYKDKEKHAILKKFVEQADALIVDEVHEYASAKRRMMIKRFKNVEYFVSLSATPYRSNSPIENLKLQAIIGSIIYEIKEEELIEAGFLSESKVFLVLFDHGYETIEKTERKFHGFQEKLVFMNDRRDLMLVHLIQALEEEGFKTLVLFSSVIHGKRIELEGGWRFISGETDSDNRTIAKDAFLKGKGGVLLASNIFKKGITLPEVEIFINADGGLEDTNIIQKRGRVIGTAKGKTKSAIVDIMDLFSEYLSDHSKNRLSVYEEVNGKDKIVGFDTEEKSWLRDIVLEIKNWMK